MPRIASTGAPTLFGAKRMAHGSHDTRHFRCKPISYNRILSWTIWPTRDNLLWHCPFVTALARNVNAPGVSGFCSVKVHKCFMPDYDSPRGVGLSWRCRTNAILVGMPLG
jgi:hypothetical protein